MTDAPAATEGLLAALLAFQTDPPHIPLDSTNPHFKSKFASLPKVTDLVRPKLADVGLVWTALPGHTEGVGPVLRYRLAHAATGEALDGEMPLMLTKADPQSLGSAITYARRYSLLTVLGLVGDDDDDANSASKAPPSMPAHGPAADEALAERAGDALRYLLNPKDPDAFAGHAAAAMRKVLMDTGTGTYGKGDGYLPWAVARALLWAAAELKAIEEQNQGKPEESPS